jgi:hypothetical protein
MWLDDDARDGLILATNIEDYCVVDIGEFDRAH